MCSLRLFVIAATAFVLLTSVAECGGKKKKGGGVKQKSKQSGQQHTTKEAGFDQVLQQQQTRAAEPLPPALLPLTKENFDERLNTVAEAIAELSDKETWFQHSEWQKTEAIPSSISDSSLKHLTKAARSELQQAFRGNELQQFIESAVADTFQTAMEPLRAAVEQTTERFEKILALTEGLGADTHPTVDGIEVEALQRQLHDLQQTLAGGSQLKNELKARLTTATQKWDASVETAASKLENIGPQIGSHSTTVDELRQRLREVCESQQCVTSDCEKHQSECMKTAKQMVNDYSKEPNENRAVAETQRMVEVRAMTEKLETLGLPTVGLRADLGKRRFNDLLVTLRTEAGGAQIQFKPADFVKFVMTTNPGVTVELKEVSALRFTAERTSLDSIEFAVRGVDNVNWLQACDNFFGAMHRVAANAIGCAPAARRGHAVVTFTMATQPFEMVFVEG